MKIRTAVMVLILLLLVFAYGENTIPLVTAQQVLSGEYNGQEVYVIAEPRFPGFDLDEDWEFREADGSFRYMLCRIDLEALRKMKRTERTGMEEGKAFIFKISIENADAWGMPEITLLDYGLYKGSVEAYEAGRTGIAGFMYQWGAYVLGFSGVMAVLIAVAAIMEKRGKDKKREQQRVSTYVNWSVVKTQIVDRKEILHSYTGTDTGNMLERAVVGNFVAGPLGAMIGASTAKQHTVTVSKDEEVTFLVWYSNGKKELETVRKSDYKYRLYLEKIE